MASEKLLDALKVTTEVCGGREFSPAAARVIVLELTAYPERAVLSALDRCRRELRSLSLADILTRIDDGRPGVEEAWAMLPHSEDESVVWTREMRDAFQVCSSMMESDLIAARMAFKEIYGRILAEARANKTPAHWEISLGQDSARRDAAIREAIQKNRITLEQAQRLLPEFRNDAPPLLAISGPAEAAAIGIPDILKIITKNIPIEAGPSDAEIEDRARRARAVIARIEVDKNGL